MNIGKVFGKILGKSKKKKVIHTEDEITSGSELSEPEWSGFEEFSFLGNPWDDSIRPEKQDNNVPIFRSGNYDFSNHNHFPSVDEVRKRLLQAEQAHKLWKIRNRLKKYGLAPSKELLDIELDARGPHKWDYILKLPIVERYVSMIKYIRAMAAKEAAIRGHTGTITSESTFEEIDKLHKKLRLDFTLDAKGNPSNVCVGEDSSSSQSEQEVDEQNTEHKEDVSFRGNIFRTGSRDQTESYWAKEGECSLPSTSLNILKEIYSFKGRNRKKTHSMPSTEYETFHTCSSTEGSIYEEASDYIQDQETNSGVSFGSRQTKILKEDKDLYVEKDRQEKCIKQNDEFIKEPTQGFISDFTWAAAGDEPSEIRPNDRTIELLNDATDVTKKNNQDVTLDENSSKILEKRKDFCKEEFKNKICRLLENYIKSAEEDAKLVTNREDVKNSMINFIDSFIILPEKEDASQQTEIDEQFYLASDCPIEQTRSITTSSKKMIDFDSTASMIFLSNEIRSISFGLDKQCNGESLLSVLNAVQSEFMRMKIAEHSVHSDGFLKSDSKFQGSNEAIQEKSHSKIQCPDSSEKFVEAGQKAILSDRDHLNNIFEFLHERISLLLQYEKDAIVTLGQLALDMQQFCTLIELLKQWSDHKLNKLSNSIGTLQNYVSNAYNSPNTSENSQRKVKIVLIRKSNQPI